MNCEGAIDRFLESLTGELDASTSADLEAHLATCAGCRESCDNLRALWRDLETLPVQSPSDALRPRFYAMLHEWRQGKRPRRTLGEILNGWLESWWPRQPVVQVAVVLLALGVGLGLGPRLRRTPSEIARLQGEIQTARRLATLSMLQQQSPSQRLQAVSFSYLLHEPDADVIQALLQTLDTDPNVNVRLAVADALGQYADLPQVRQGLIDSFPRQTSPLVQIALIDQLVQMGDAQIGSMLRQVAQDSTLNKSVRERAQWGLQRPL